MRAQSFLHWAKLVVESSAVDSYIYISLYRLFLFNGSVGTVIIDNLCLFVNKSVAVDTSSNATGGTGQVVGGSTWCCQDSVVSDETMSSE